MSLQKPSSNSFKSGLRISFARVMDRALLFTFHIPILDKYFLDVKKIGPSPICPRMPPELNLLVNKCCGFVEKKFALE